MSESIFKNYKLRWSTFNVFGNLFNINTDKGYIEPILDNDAFMKKCQQNCNIFEPGVKELCLQYCREETNLRHNSNLFAKEACPSKDVECCKKAAGDNDFAFLECIGKKNLSSSKRNHGFPIYLIAIIITLILLIIFLFFLFAK